MAHRRRIPIGVAMACAVLVAAACGQGATVTTTPKTAAPPTVGPATAEPTIAAATPGATTPAPASLKLIWESTGDGVRSGTQPATYSPAVDPLTGDIWVAVSFDGIIWIFSNDGEYKGSFGKPGKGDGEFNFVRASCSPCGAGALAFAPDGSLFVADTGNSRIQKFDAAHNFVKAWGTFGAGASQFADANQIVTNGREVFVSDGSREDTQVFSTDGTYLRKIPDGGGWLAIDPSGDVFISENGGLVTRYHPDGTLVSSVQLPDYRGAEHIGLALDDNGRLFFDYQQVARPNVTIGLGAIDLASSATTLWANGGETIAIAGNVLYEANFTTTAWPKAVLRAYELPAP